LLVTGFRRYDVRGFMDLRGADSAEAKTEAEEVRQANENGKQQDREGAEAVKDQEAGQGCQTVQSGDLGKSQKTRQAIEIGEADEDVKAGQVGQARQANPEGEERGCREEGRAEASQG
jgi:hypothetical protein